MRKWKPAWLAPLCTLAALCAQTTAGAQGSSAEAQRFGALMNAERSLNVGKVLSGGIEVHDRSGKTVDLHKAVKGPLTLLKFNPGCPPCVTVFKYLQVHASQYTSAQGATLAVLVVESKDASDYVGEGAPVAYTTPSKLEGSVLAGEITPSVFFFDKDLRLIERRAGLTTPELMLRYPQSP